MRAFNRLISKNSAMPARSRKPRLVTCAAEIARISAEMAASLVEKSLCRNLATGSIKVSEIGPIYRATFCAALEKALPTWRQSGNAVAADVRAQMQACLDKWISLLKVLLTDRGRHCSRRLIEA